jgi:uncharacterized protein YeaC (DUF1315 family)
MGGDKPLHYATIRVNNDLNRNLRPDKERSMNFEKLIDSINPETYANLQRALELGKWADGTRLTQEQRENVMQAIIAYGERHLPEELRVGYIDRGTKAEGGVCDDEEIHQPIKFIQ